MKDNEFLLSKLETRSMDKNGKPEYIVRGYATNSNHIYPYKVSGERTFREYFSDKGIENIYRKAKNSKIFIDIEHQVGAKASGEYLIKQLQEKTGKDFTSEIDHLKAKFKNSDIPMFKVEEIKIDEKGLFVDLRGNPFYRDIDEEHKVYFDSIWGSLENGFLNAMSLNMKTTETVPINNGLTQIDNADIFGISLLQGAANDMAPITEVAMRGLEQIKPRGEAKCLKTTSLLM